MKLIIDFPDELKDEFNQKGLTDQLLIKAKEKNGATVLLDNATNGDVIKALFPNIEKDNERLIQEYGSRALYDTFEKWCELPYKVGDTDG